MPRSFSAWARWRRPSASFCDSACGSDAMCFQQLSMRALPGLFVTPLLLADDPRMRRFGDQCSSTSQKTQEAKDAIVRRQPAKGLGVLTDHIAVVGKSQGH